MDLSFLRRAQTMFASRSAARLDHGVLMAMLQTMQAASQTARTSRGFGFEARSRQDPLVELLLAGPGWREAAAAQGGCFHRAQAERMRGGR